MFSSRDKLGMLDFVPARFVHGQNRQRLLFYPLNYEEKIIITLAHFAEKIKIRYNISYKFPNMKKIITVLFIFFASCFFVQTSFSAGSFGLDKTAVQAGYETGGMASSIEGRIQVVISAFLGLMALVFFGLILYGGIIWLTARGKEESVTKAKGILEAAIIGLIIVVFSYAIATFVLSRLNPGNEKNGCCYYGDPVTEVEMTQEACSQISGSAWYDGSCTGDD